MFKTFCKIVVVGAAMWSLTLFGFKAGKSAARNEMAMENLKCENEKLKAEINSKKKGS